MPKSNTLAALLFAALLPAQTPPLVSPEVHPDRRVTFRIQAPKAADVGFYGDWMPVGTIQKMRKDAKGIWSITTGPLDPSVYIYSFTVDGLTIADPINPLVKLRARTSASLVEVPAATPTLWDPRDVPHGSVEINYQMSKALNGQTQSFWVYTPPGYTQNVRQRYPILYLFHGSNDTAGGWVLVGHANYLFDNLIATDKMVPAIVVMPFGHAVPFTSPKEIQATNVAVFEKYVIEDVLPFVEGKYRTRKERDQRAIAGLSMGGAQALAIGFRHLDLFGAIGAFSAGAPPNLEPHLGGLEKDKLKVLWLGVGKQDALFQRSADLDTLFTKHGIDHTFRVTPGAHTYTVWRQYLSEFAPLLFR
jgi:enterochelin esterase-like enzyme